MLELLYYARKVPLFAVARHARRINTHSSGVSLNSDSAGTPGAFANFSITSKSTRLTWLVVNSLKGGQILNGKVGNRRESGESAVIIQAMPLPMRLLPLTSWKLDP